MLILALGTSTWVLALTIPELVLKENRYPFNFREFITSFWTNPIRFPDFGLAWWGRFLIIFASMLFMTFRPMYMTRHLGLSGDEGAYAIAIGVTIYTITVMIAGIAAGWISDLLRRRKAIVALSSVLFAIATYLLAHADTVGHFYMIEALMGIAIGMYFAVDMALRQGPGRVQHRQRPAAVAVSRGRRLAAGHARPQHGLHAAARGRRRLRPGRSRDHYAHQIRPLSIRRAEP